MDDKLSIFVCGDIINLTGNISFIGSQLAEEIKQADFAIGNFEGVELCKEQGLPQKPSQTAGTINYLSQVGFDMLLLANNHITDFGPEQMRYTIDTIKKEGILHIGAGFSWQDTYKPVIVEIKGMKLGFINICEAQVGQMASPKQEFGYAWIGYDHLLEDVSTLSKIVDRVVVLAHAGLEHYTLPLPEIRNLYQRICDAGASAVIGGHPHIAQGYELYKNSFIAYSLGNFYFPHKPGVYENENTSYSLLLEFYSNGHSTTRAIHHSLNNGTVEVEENPNRQVDINKLCDLLGEGYDKRANEMCVKAYDVLCNNMLVESLCGEKDNQTKLEIVKYILRRTIFRKKYITSTKKEREKILLRLFENETYRYTIIRALKNK